MKKIGIITLNGYFNYGNRLQNYALQKRLEKMGYQVDTIINSTKNKERKKRTVVERARSVARLPLSNIVSITEKKVKNKIFSERNKQRTNIFKDFSNKYINETDFSISEHCIPEGLLESYDYFVTGSDQVWNPYYQKGSPIEFLTFAPKHKRISYAASFGISRIPEEYKEKYATWLTEMNHISVREEAGAEIVKELTGREVDVVVDPTLLLTKEEWLEVAEIPSNKPLKGYVLTYFLGEIPRERKNYIKQVAKKYDLEIINLAQMNEKTPYLSGPSEFIDYINSAEIFFTDSFHGVVFSLIFNTPFIVFERKGNSPSMGSRIETLLKAFGMEDRFFNNFTNNAELLNVDFSKVDIMIKNEKMKAMEYLNRALN